ncbi:MAG: TSUP family transporter, partial [Acetobacteraceae bacterium]
MAAIGLLMLVSYASLLAAAGLAKSVPPMMAIACAAGISSIAGFAFSAVSQALLAPLMHNPVLIVQILMVCSITTQSFAIVSLWRYMDWKGLPVYLAGGALGLPIGIYLLLHLDLGGFHTAIGALLIVYGTYVLVKRPITLKRVSWPANVAVGFLGGITCGL